MYNFAKKLLNYTWSFIEEFFAVQESVYVNQQIDRVTPVNQPIIDNLLTTMPPKIIKLSKLIHEYEGNKPWHRAVRNKNPGNCRYYPKGYLAKYGTVTKDKDGFAVFETMDIGWLYLQNMLLSWAKGSRADWTILRMMKSYAPSSDGNDPIAYSNYLSKYLGVGQDAKLKDLLV